MDFNRTKLFFLLLLKGVESIAPCTKTVHEVKDSGTKLEKFD